MLAQAAPPVIRDHHPIGASTGYMADLRGDWEAQVRKASEVSTFAIELSALGEEELDGLLEYLAREPGLPFRYISVHGPSKGRRMSEGDLVERLLELPDDVSAIVMHPDTIQDPAVYEPLGWRLVLENLDSRASRGATVDELAALFAELPEAGFCFDIAHAWSVDPRMNVASELLDRLMPRLRHVHLSSLVEHRHAPLTTQHWTLFAPLMRRCIDVPWIFEAPPLPLDA